MRLDETRCRELLLRSRVAHLATVGGDFQPHIVPITFALIGQVLFSAIDDKPKQTKRLKRLRNIEDNPAVAVVVDEYSEDWTQLWWVRADGTARTATDEVDAALAALVAKYPQYSGQPPGGPVIEVTITNITGWAYG